MAGWPPSGPPRFFAGFPGLRRRILSVPPGSDRVPGVRTAMVTSTGLLDPRLPPRPMVSRTRSSPTSTSSSTPRTAPPGPPRRAPRPRSSTPGTAAGSSRTAATEQINWCTKSVSLSAFSAGAGLPIEPYYLPVLPRPDRLLRDRSTGQKTYCTTPATSALPDPMTLSPRPRARLLQVRHVGSDYGRGPVTPRTSPRLTTAHSGHPPGPAADSSARGCSARGTSGATDPGSLR
jgi:hypothetical protein